jgi:hypothetical protein
MTPEEIRDGSEPELNTGCWLWRDSGRNNNEYGTAKHDGKWANASRTSWIVHNGPIPIGPSGRTLYVCHKCDTPPCVNPAHLFLGTQADNMADMRAKGRVGLPYTAKRRTMPYVSQKSLIDPGVTRIRALAKAAGIEPVVLGRQVGLPWGIWGYWRMGAKPRQDQLDALDVALEIELAERATNRRD